ncbi:MAG: pantothenate kinase [Candidatus Bathyarchaeia archaeon]
MIIGVDVGASITKGVLLDKMKIVDSYMIPTTETKFSALKVLKYFVNRVGGDYKKLIDVVTISGGKTQNIKDDLLDLPIKKVDEIRATGLGGLLLTGKNEGLIVNAGTGTAMVAAYDKGRRVNHICGTGVGGGTILGLSKRLLGITDFEILENMAAKGNPNKVDLTVADIVGRPIGIVPSKATASNFGKLTDEAKEEDIAAGIFNLVSQVIGVLAVMAAKACNLERNIILVGGLVRSRIVSQSINNTVELFGGNTLTPQNCEYSTALGAAGYIYLFEKGSLE